MRPGVGRADGGPTLLQMAGAAHHLTADLLGWKVRSRAPEAGVDP